MLPYCKPCGLVRATSCFFKATFRNFQSELQTRTRTRVDAGDASGPTNIGVFHSSLCSGNRMMSGQVLGDIFRILGEKSGCIRIVNRAVAWRLLAFGRHVAHVYAHRQKARTCIVSRRIVGPWHVFTIKIHRLPPARGRYRAITSEDRRAALLASLCHSSAIVLVA